MKGRKLLRLTQDSDKSCYVQAAADTVWETAEEEQRKGKVMNLDLDR